ncbi:uncharacterized protein LOC144422826 [Styela clava]
MSVTSNNPTSVVLQCLEYIEMEYPGYLEIYTDGSKSATRRGAVFFIPDCDVSNKFRLDSLATSYCTELYAIYRSLIWISQNRSSKVLILCDCLSALESIQNIWDVKHLLSTKIQLLHSIICHTTDIKFLWIPAHIGINGNEAVDRLAKDGANGIVINAVLQRSLKEAKTLCKQACLAKWNLTY